MQRPCNGVIFRVTPAEFKAARSCRFGPGADITRSVVRPDSTAAQYAAMP